MSAEDLTLTSWQAALQDTVPTDNMLRWMSKFDKLCAKACCYSPMCGCIRCTNCRTSLTSNDHPKVRYQCMQCPVVLKGPSSRPELCEACFLSENIALHDHTRFCKVDKHGVHTMTKRKRIVPRKQLLESDFIPVAIAQQACAVCCEPFTETKQAVSPAGCQRGHGESKSDPNYGVVDTGIHYCAECALEFEQMRDRGTYCDMSICCKCCQHEDEMQRWKEEFLEMFAQTIDPTSVNNDMYALHLQPWIRAVLEEEFTARMKQLSLEVSETFVPSVRTSEETECDGGQSCALPNNGKNSKT